MPLLHHSLKEVSHASSAFFVRCAKYFTKISQFFLKIITAIWLNIFVQ